MSEEESQIFTVRTTAGREKQVMEKLATLIKNKGYEIYALMAPNEIKGYFFVEADNIESVRIAVYGIQHVKGVVNGNVTMKEIEHFFSPISEIIKVKKDDIVELTSGPFKGDKARIKRVDNLKEEVIVELLEAAVSIPLTVKMDSIRVLKM